MIAVLRNALLLTIGYYLALLAGAVARFGKLPDTLRLDPWLENVWSVLSGFPTLRQAWPVALREPLLEIGRSVPELPLAEWSVQVLPAKTVIVALAALLLASYWRLARRRYHPACAVLAGLGSAGTALASASLTWVACCSSPSWAVILAMLGIWIPTAMSFEPYGAPIIGTGVVLLVIALAIQIRATGFSHQCRDR
jgi:hypothetical protein